MIAAADPVIGNQAKFEPCPAMRTVELEQAHRAAAVAESHEILAHDAQAARQVPQFLGQDDRLPIPPQILTAERAWPDSGELLVSRRPLAVVVRAEGVAQKCCFLCHGIPPWAPQLTSVLPGMAAREQPQR